MILANVDLIDTLGVVLPPLSCRNSAIDVGETSVSKYMGRRRRPPPQMWRTFLNNHLATTVSVDFFTVPTIRFQVLYVSWCWPTTDAGSCMSMSRTIPATA